MIRSLSLAALLVLAPFALHAQEQASEPAQQSEGDQSTRPEGEPGPQARAPEGDPQQQGDVAHAEPNPDQPATAENPDAPPPAKPRTVVAKAAAPEKLTPIITLPAGEERVTLEEPYVEPSGPAEAPGEGGGAQAIADAPPEMTPRNE